MSKEIIYNRNRPYTVDLWKGIQQAIGVTADGIVGEKTVEGLKNFQAEHGMRADGLCGRVTLSRISLTKLAEQAGVWFDGHLQIDADGSPMTYNSFNTGYDNLANAGAPGNYYGLSCDKAGNPYVWQNANGNQHYVSQTALVNPKKKPWDPERFVDSTYVDYVVIPRNWKNLSSVNVALGDVGLVFRLNNLNQRVPVICADIGPTKQSTQTFGEGSIQLALGFEVDVWDYREKQIDGETVQYKRASKGSSDEFIYLMFPGTGKGRALSVAEITNLVDTAFDAWGGLDRLKLLFSKD